MARSLSLNCLTGQIGGVAETVQACLSVDDPGCGCEDDGSCNGGYNNSEDTQTANKLGGLSTFIPILFQNLIKNFVVTLSSIGVLSEQKSTQLNEEASHPLQHLFEYMVKRHNEVRLGQAPSKMFPQSCFLKYQNVPK